MSALSAEATKFYELIKDLPKTELRVLGALLTLLELPHGDVDMSTPLAGQRYMRMLLGILYDDMFRGEQFVDERAAIAKHLAHADRRIAELEGAAG